MQKKRIGTIIHGALGDCYEQLCAIKLLKNHGERWIGFFVVKERLDAMKHFNIDMLDETYMVSDIANVEIDYFFQFQIKDMELQEYVFSKISHKIRSKFDFTVNIKPWQIIRTHDFRKEGLKLELSETGKDYLPVCMNHNLLSESTFQGRITVGYLWRYRTGRGAAIKPYFQRPKEWILKTKTELFNKLIAEYNAHIIIAGMNKNISGSPVADSDVLKNGAVRTGEYKAKYATEILDIPSANCTYLKGLGYAAEMEIMSRCSFLIMMPSGFSEPLWMRRDVPVVAVDPPPDYILRLTYNRVPFFNNLEPKYFIYNAFKAHTADNVMRFLKSIKILPSKGLGYRK